MFKQIPIEHRWVRILFLLILTCSVRIESANSQSRTRAKANATPELTAQASPTPSLNPFVIPVTQVATEAIQLNQRLRSLPERIVSSESLAEIEQEINKLKETTDRRARETETAIQSGAIFSDLQQSSLDWQGLKKELEDLSETLTKHTNVLENEIKLLTSDQPRWVATNEHLKGQESPPELLDLIGKAVNDIGAAVQLVDERRGRIVSLQQSLAKQSSVIATEMEHLDDAMAQSQRSLLEADSPPLWKTQFAEENSAARLLLRTSSMEDASRIKTFLRAKRTPLILITVLSIAVLALFLRLGRATASGATQVDLNNPRSIFNQPVALALLFFLVATMPLLFGAPLSIVGVVNLVGMVPVLTLLTPRLSKTFRQMLVALVASVLVWHLIKVIQFATWVKRDLLAVFTLTVIVLFVWLVRQAQHVNLNKKQIVALFAAYAGIALLVLGLLANVFGYVRLSDLLTQGTLASAYRAVALYTVVVFGGLLIAFIFQARPPQQLAGFRTGPERVVRRLSFALALIMFLIWVNTALNQFAVRQDVYAAIRAALDYQIRIGSAGFTVSNVVAFVLTLFFGYFLASIIRAILGDAILPRLNLARGVPNAVATVTYYFALVLIFVLALAASGVELSKFTILTGAFGVGLGFGLQNVVNNFVSGLILLFERPVRVGDILEIKGVGGEVTKIGFRSSTVHAFDGSDLIIPNGTLISEQVTNWTLTGTHRKIILNIHVGYGNDPTKVRDLLSATAAADPQVLEYPKPIALFLGFGDSALNFEVWFWAPRPEVVPELRSEVALNIAAALSEAGINVPVPQRSLHITGLDQSNLLEDALRQPQTKAASVDGGERGHSAQES